MKTERTLFLDQLLRTLFLLIEETSKSRAVDWSSGRLKAPVWRLLFVRWFSQRQEMTRSSWPWYCKVWPRLASVAVETSTCWFEPSAFITQIS